MGQKNNFQFCIMKKCLVHTVWRSIGADLNEDSHMSRNRARVYA